MKVVLTNPFSELGVILLKELTKRGHEVLAIGEKEDKLNIDKVEYSYSQISDADLTTYAPKLKGYDAIIIIPKFSLVNKFSSTSLAYDYIGGFNEILRLSNFKKIIFVSSLNANTFSNYFDYKLMLDFEKELIGSGKSYVIHHANLRFSELDYLINVYINNYGNHKVTKSNFINPISDADLGEFIAKTVRDDNKIYNIGGKETYSFNELLLLRLETKLKPYDTKLISISDLKNIHNKVLKKDSNLNLELSFLQAVLSDNLIGENTTGQKSFKNYIRQNY